MGFLGANIPRRRNAWPLLFHANVFRRGRICGLDGRMEQAVCSPEELHGAAKVPRAWALMRRDSFLDCTMAWLHVSKERQEDWKACSDQSHT